MKLVDLHLKTATSTEKFVSLPPLIDPSAFLFCFFKVVLLVKVIMRLPTKGRKRSVNLGLSKVAAHIILLSR